MHYLFSLNETMAPRLSPIIIPLRATNLRVDIDVTVVERARARSPVHLEQRKISGIGSTSPHFLRPALTCARAGAPLCHSSACNHAPPHPARDALANSLRPDRP